MNEAENSNSYKVYKYTFPDGVTYVGVTKGSIQNRRDCGYQHNQRLKDEISRFGWKSVKTEILEDALQMDIAFQKEQEYIAIEKERNPDKNVNISPGGKSTFKGLRHTEEYKSHMSELYKGRQYADETIHKMRQSHAKERKPVAMCNENNDPIRFYESLGDAAADICGHKTNISRACNSGKMYKGMLWMFMEGGGLG